LLYFKFDSVRFFFWKNDRAIIRPKTNQIFTSGIVTSGIVIHFPYTYHPILTLPTFDLIVSIVSIAFILFCPRSGRYNHFVNKATAFHKGQKSRFLSASAAHLRASDKPAASILMKP